MNVKTIIQSHWLGFLFLLPFLSMLALHDALGLTDAALLVRDQRDRDSQMFNFAMIAVFYLGVTLFIAHAFFLARRSKPWLCGKLAFLAAYWSAILFLR
jgi:hypothetical protein